MSLTTQYDITWHIWYITYNQTENSLSYAFWAFLKNAHYVLNWGACSRLWNTAIGKRHPSLSGNIDMAHMIWYKPVDFERVQLPTRDQPASPTRPSSLNIKRCSSFSYNSKLEKIEKFENLNFKWNSLSVIIWMIQVVIHRVFSLILHKLFSLNIF